MRVTRVETSLATKCCPHYNELYVDVFFQPQDKLMTTLQIELPDNTALAARAAGLLTPQALDRLLTQALRRREAADSLLSVAGRVAAADVPPMSMEEINAEVKATRAARGPRH
jgi:hypothetical protein